jgi:hypothetical protein
LGCVTGDFRSALSTNAINSNHLALVLYHFVIAVWRAKKAEFRRGHMDWKSPIKLSRIHALIAALICVAVGIGVAMLWTGRYEFRTFLEMPIRCDRWTGKVEFVMPESWPFSSQRPVPSPSSGDIFDQLARERKSAKPTPNK